VVKVPHHTVWCIELTLKAVNKESDVEWHFIEKRGKPKGDSGTLGKKKGR
jgi:hypothetical protein